MLTGLEGAPSSSLEPALSSVGKMFAPPPLVSMKVRWGSDGDGKHGYWKRAVSPKCGSQGEDLQVRKVSTVERRHKEEVPSLVFPTI
jgi:hypothetical protein